MSPNDNDLYTESPEPTSEPAAPITSRRRNIFGGALLGAVALTASVVAVGAVAGAQDEPAVDDEAAGAFEADEMEDGAEIVELDEMELDDDMMIEGLEFDDEAWAAFDECLTGQLGDLDEDGFEEQELTDEQWEALEQQFEDAEKACEDLLPEDVKAEIAAFEAFDQCLVDAGLPGDDDFGTVVFVEDGESGQSIQFGDTPGTVTITGDASGVSVATEGGVSVIDDAAFDDAFAGCEDLLPEGMYDLDEGEFDEEAEFDIEDGDLDEDDEFDTDDEDEGDEDA